MVEDHTRYRVIEHQEYPPGTCFVTGTPNGPFLDTGIFIRKERWGQLVLSKDFIEEAAHLLGLFNDQDEKVLAAYDAGYKNGVKENISGVVNGALDQLGFAVDVLRSLDAGDLADVQVADITESTPARKAGGRKRSAQRSDETAGQDDNAAVDERPAVVPAGSSDGDTFRV